MIKLEDIFHCQKDKNQIREIQEKVEEYERNDRETAEEIERERLKNTEQSFFIFLRILTEL